MDLPLTGETSVRSQMRRRTDPNPLFVDAKLTARFASLGVRVFIKVDVSAALPNLSTSS